MIMLLEQSRRNHGSFQAENRYTITQNHIYFLSRYINQDSNVQQMNKIHEKDYKWQNGVQSDKYFEDVFINKNVI